MLYLDCPENDWTCPYFDNGRCTLEDAKEQCEFFDMDEED